MVDYPYPTSFLSPLPGWPVKLACSFLKNVSKNDEDAARSLFNVVNLYYNYTGIFPSPSLLPFLHLRFDSILLC